jgi:PucR C-terminal helix-turn-helix domain
VWKLIEAASSICPVRRLLSARGGDSGASEALVRVVQRFDDMVAESADLDALIAAAAEMVRADVSALDVLNGRFVGASAGGGATGNPTTGRAILRAVEHLGTREVARCTIDTKSFFAVSVEHGRGRLGVVWTPKPELDWTDNDELVLERLAQAASIAIQQDQRRVASRWKAGDPSALELLVGGLVDEPSRAEAIRSARLSAEQKYVVIGTSLAPPHVVSDVVAIAVVGRALDEQSGYWRAVTVMNAPLIISTSEATLESALNSAVVAADQNGWRLAIGVGDAVHPADLHRSAVQAREALVLGGSEDEGGVTFFSRLGVLHLLSCIPRSALDLDTDIAAVTALANPGSRASDLALLITYCETGSLRKTGERMYLHHSSVEYRVRRLEAALGFSLSTPTGRFRALLAASLVRMSRASDLS